MWKCGITIGLRLARSGVVLPNEWPNGDDRYNEIPALNPARSRQGSGATLMWLGDHGAARGSPYGRGARRQQPDVERRGMAVAVDRVQPGVGRRWAGGLATSALVWSQGFSDQGLSREDLAWLRSLTDLPPILTASDSAAAQDCGDACPKWRRGAR